MEHLRSTLKQWPPLLLSHLSHDFVPLPLRSLNGTNYSFFGPKMKDILECVSFKTITKSAQETKKKTV